MVNVTTLSIFNFLDASPNTLHIILPWVTSEDTLCYPEVRQHNNVDQYLFN